MSLRYDAAFYVQVLDKYVATGECAEADNEPLYAYLLSVMNDPMIKIQVLSDELCARIFYDAMSQFIRLLKGIIFVIHAPDRDSEKISVLL